ncbi:glucose N-acetyltransferase [Colletotrichum costaricense]|uniref:Glucose N-acetyltransferase n=1 Tax=Colletotrichum costaricense TaxID=1209916 RepID=A0AAI9YUJ1_9PEZI|nr:glucose N-acetyltransferase [Colletotrichum costaricense]KAK1524360.1 glucose N-acetyltransferase [Colletotrichum costaricense]
MAVQGLFPSWHRNKGLDYDAVESDSSSRTERPSLSEVIASKRFRWLVGTVIGALLVVFVLDNSVQVSRFRRPTSSSSQVALSQVEGAKSHTDVDWSRFAYVQYATNTPYLCNSVMVFERLQHLQSKADRILLYPSEMLDPLAATGNTKDASLLIHARDTYGVKLIPITVQHRKGSDPTWAESFTKLLAFNQTQYNRVLSIDSDSTLLQNIDELFLSPPATVAVPRAYWLYPEKKIVASHIMLVQPSVAEFARIVEKVDHAGKEEYDMEIINDLYKDSAMILPHRPYALLTRSFGGDHQDYYLANSNEVWDAVTVYNEAKYLHFSDWPMHKPWLKSSDSLIKERQPDCVVRDGNEDCTARELWLSFYTDFRARRSQVCGINT